MDVTLRFHSLFWCVVLIAVGGQAVTPHSRNLASVKVFRVLSCATDCSIPGQNSNEEQEEVSALIHPTQIRLRLTLMFSTTISEVAFTQFAALANARNSSSPELVRAQFTCRDGLMGQLSHKAIGPRPSSNKRTQMV